MANSITPPPELVEQWANDSVPMKANAIGKDWEIAFASRAAQWGADQELEACCQHVDWVIGGLESKELRAARRPNHPTRKERALKALDGLALPDDAFETICFALEALPND
jgi:hypothetical protein